MIRVAINNDVNVISNYDKHITKEELSNLIKLNRVLIIEDNNKLVGWLRYNLFWDNTPFMNMIYILDEYRGRGFGKECVIFWEKYMKNLRYDLVMTSTASDEYAQHFYNKLGYLTIGGFLLDGDPYEIVFSKKI